VRLSNVSKAIFCASIMSSRVWWSPISGLCQRYRLQIPFGAFVSGGKNPVPNANPDGIPTGQVLPTRTRCSTEPYGPYSTGILPIAE